MARLHNVLCNLCGFCPLPSLIVLLSKRLFCDSATALGTGVGRARRTLRGAGILDGPLASDMIELARVCYEHAGNLCILGVFGFG